MIRGVHHTNLATGDLDRLLGFYRDLLGFEVIWWNEWEPGAELADTIVGLKDSSVRMAMLRAGNTYIEIMQYRQPLGRPALADRQACDHGLVHLCFDVTDMAAEYQRLVDAGVPFNSEPMLAGDLYSVYGRDPDGNLFELQELLTEDHNLTLPWLPDPA